MEGTQIRALTFCKVSTNTVFWSPSVKVGESAAFQISLSAPTSISISSLPISSLAIYLREKDDSPVVLRHSPEMEGKGASSTQLVNVGHVVSQESVKVEANLRWDLGGTLVVAGTMSSDVPTVLKVGSFISNYQQC